MSRASPLARCRGYVSKIPAAVEGNGGNDRTYQVACAAVCDFNLSDAEAFTVLSEYSSRCSPPWSERDLQGFLAHARKYGRNPPGAKLGEESHRAPGVPATPSSGAMSATTERLRPLSRTALAEQWRNRRAMAVVPSGVEALDAAIGGGYPVGQVTTIIGYTGSGKSEIARQSINAAARQGHGVGHVDVELGPNRITERNVSQASGVASALLRRPEDLTTRQNELVERAIAKLAADPVLTICPGGGVPLLDLEPSIERALAQLPSERPRLIVLDSIQRLAAGAEGDTQRLQVQAFMWWAASIAAKFEAAVVLTSEQRRSPEGTAPTAEEALTSGAESRSVEFVSDVVLVLVPQDKAEDSIAEDAGGTFERRVSVLVAKTREGRTGYIPQDIVFVGPCWDMRVEAREDALTEAIRDALADGDVHATDEIAKAAGKRKSAVLARLRQMAGVSGELEHVQGPVKGYRKVGSRDGNLALGSVNGNRADFREPTCTN